MSVLGLVLVGLAGYRLARLVALDTITEPVRDWLDVRARRPLSVWLMRLVSCPFCVGVWITTPLAIGWLAAADVRAPWFHQVVFVAACVGAQSAITALDHD